MIISAVVLGLLLAGFLAIRVRYPQPYKACVRASGVDPALVYAVIKAESGFREEAISRAGAVGLMQIKPSTAEFICERENIPFSAERLREGEYNIELGCKYLCYLYERFEDMQTALAAYNAGEGTVAQWLKEETFSPDGKRLTSIPYLETSAYVKKILRYQKVYRLFYR